MGFFDKIKRFAGGHGVTVEIAEVEGAAPGEAAVAANARTLRGVIRVRAEQDATILSHIVELSLVRDEDPDDPEDPGRQIDLAHQVRTDEAAAPYTLAAGHQAEDKFVLELIDLAAALEEAGVDPEEAPHRQDVRLQLRVVADVKGTPIDAKAETTLAIAPPCAENVEHAGMADIPVRTQPLPLDPRPWKERFEAMVAELRAHPEVQIVEESFEPPADPATLDSIAAEHPLPAALRDFYSQMNGFTLSWRLRSQPADRDAIGNIRILPVEQVYGSWKDVIWFDAEWDDGRFKQLHPFDFFVPEACAALRLDGDPNPKVHYHYCGEEDLPMEVDAAGYLELLLRSRGYWYWPKAVAADLEGSATHPNHIDFRLTMARLFPDFDPSFFFRTDYSITDEVHAEAQRSKAPELREELTRRGASFELIEGGIGEPIRLLVPPTADNMRKVAEAVSEVVGYKVTPPTEGEEWGMLQVGDIYIEAAR